MDDDFTEITLAVADRTAIMVSVEVGTDWDCALEANDRFTLAIGLACELAQPEKVLVQRRAAGREGRRVERRRRVAFDRAPDTADHPEAADDHDHRARDSDPNPRQGKPRDPTPAAHASSVAPSQHPASGLESAGSGRCTVGSATALRMMRKEPNSTTRDSRVRGAPVRAS